MENKITATDEICQTIKKAESQYKAALPSHLPSERFVRVAQTAIRVSPKLALCDKSSLYGAILRCAQSGLLPDGQEAAIVPWGSSARFMPMVKGLCKQARNSGEIKFIDAINVYENDTYSYWVDDDGPHFKFEAARKDRGGPILTFAYAKTKDGGLYFEEILEEEMNKIAAMSKADDSPWKGPFRNEMKRKSAIRRLAKYRLPSSTDLDEVIRRDDDLYEFDKPTETETDKPKSQTPRLNDIINKSTDTTATDEVSTEEVPI